MFGISTARIQNSYNEDAKIENSLQNQQRMRINNRQRNKIADGSLQNGEVTQFYFKTLIELELALSIVIIISLYLIITAADTSFPKIIAQKQSTINTSLYFSLLCVVISIFILIMRSFTLLQLQKQQKRIYQKATIFSTSKILNLLIQCVILIIQPYPIFNYSIIGTVNSFSNYQISFPVNDILTILSFSRIYILFRTALELTPYMSNRSHRLCKMYGCRADFSFSLKCLFRDNPLTLICIFFITSSVFFAYLIYIAERQLSVQTNGETINNLCNNFLNSLWLILITVTTVGYGDYYPQTPFGRVIILFVAIWGTFIVSIMVVVVSNTLMMQKSQQRTSKILTKLYLREELAEKSRFLIGYFVLLKHSIKHPSKYSLKQKKSFKQRFNQSKNDFTEKKRQIKSIAEYDDIEDEVAAHFLKLNSDIDILNSNQDKIISFIHQNFNYQEQLHQNYQNQTKQDQDLHPIQQQNVHHFHQPKVVSSHQKNQIQVKLRRFKISSNIVPNNQVQESFDNKNKKAEEIENDQNFMAAFKSKVQDTPQSRFYEA